MTVYLVSRHQGAIDWIDHMGYGYDEHLTHLQDYTALSAGDTVVGSLPINIVADLNALGVTYQHLSLYIPENLRGVELSAEQLSTLNAEIETYQVKRLP